MSMPAQKPGKSKQDYQTPPEFLAAVKNRLRIRDFDVDVAASKENAVCEYYYDEASDGLAQSWQVPEPESGWAWCNPPYSNIQPWVHKAHEEARNGVNIALLVPASVGANWWRECVEPFAYAAFLNGRITFVGADGPYPKDCALLLYTPWGFTGTEIWTWGHYVPKLQQVESSEG